MVCGVTPRSRELLPRARRRPGAASCSRKYAAAISCTFSSASRSAGIAARVVAVALGRLGQRHAELLRQHPHRVLEADLLVQLEELEHVAADVCSRSSGRTPCPGSTWNDGVFSEWNGQRPL